VKRKHGVSVARAGSTATGAGATKERNRVAIAFSKVD
jgi:hypothetical protein